MADPDQIPHLLKLLDDESPDVRTAVAEELSAFGLPLKDELKKIKISLAAPQKKHIERILQAHRRKRFKDAWPAWDDPSDTISDVDSDYRRLETALTILAEFLSDLDHDYPLGELLDELATAYQSTYKQKDPQTLAKFLFRDEKLKGDEQNYYNVQNSNLVYVIKERKGLPISLTALYMLVGWRSGIRIDRSQLMPM